MDVQNALTWIFGRGRGRIWYSIESHPRAFMEQWSSMSRLGRLDPAGQGGETDSRLGSREARTYDHSPASLGRCAFVLRLRSKCPAEVFARRVFPDFPSEQAVVDVLSAKEVFEYFLSGEFEKKPGYM